MKPTYILNKELCKKWIEKDMAENNVQINGLSPRDYVLIEMKKKIHDSVRKSFFAYQKRWVTIDPKQLRENWTRFKRFFDAEIGD